MFYIESGDSHWEKDGRWAGRGNSPIQIQRNLHIRACNFVKVLCILFSHLCLVSRVCVLDLTALIHETRSTFRHFITCLHPHPPPLHPPNLRVRFCMKWSVEAYRWSRCVAAVILNLCTKWQSSGQLHTPAALPPARNLVQFIRRLCGPYSRSEYFGRRENLCSCRDLNLGWSGMYWEYVVGVWTECDGFVRILTPV